MYKLSTRINPDKAFIINRSALEERLEPEYYRPSITEIENRIRKHSRKKLRDYIKRIASGATPSVQEEEKYYSDKENGVPFLRVQNLQIDGHLSLDDVKHINKVTHEKDLKRSQVAEGDLLVKITGVGRMAIASVAPGGFVGNTNQHMVVIKTDNKETSEYLATYLNLDIVEKIASRRSTGGTRPALDYSALKSIPVIEHIDFSLIKKADDLKREKERQVELLSVSKDAYLLKELGITLPLRNKSLQSRMFAVSFKDVTGSRLDPLYFKNLDRIESDKFESASLRKVAKILKGQSITKEKVEEGIYPVIAGGQTSPYSNSAYNFDGNVITVSASGAYSGYVWYHKNPIFASDCNVIKSKNEEEITTEYIYYVLKALQTEIYRLQQGAGQPHVYARDIEKIPIPIPSKKIQSEILLNINRIQMKIITLQNESNSILADAKAEVEKMILG